jgi:hypothetical protein
VIVRRGFAAVILGFLIAACSPSASVAPSLTPSPEPTATPSPSASQSSNGSVAPSFAPLPSASTAADPAIGLTIGPPYALTPLDPTLEASLRQQYGASAGAFASLIGVGGRQVTANGIPVAFVFVIGLPSGVMSDTVYQSMLNGIASNTGVTLKTTTIAGTEVSSGATATGNIGIYRDGDRLIMIIAPTDLNAVAEALIAANK